MSVQRARDWGRGHFSYYHIPISHRQDASTCPVPRQVDGLSHQVEHKPNGSCCLQNLRWLWSIQSLHPIETSLP